MLRSHTVCAIPNGGLGGGKSVKKFIEDALAVPTSSAKRAGRRQSCMLRGRRRCWTEQVQGARRRCVGRRRARGERQVARIGLLPWWLLVVGGGVVVSISEALDTALRRGARE